MQIPGFKILDRYIIRKYIGTFLLSILMVIGIVIVFDISEKIDDFVQKEAPLKAIIFDYYANFIPYILNMYSPIFVFLTVIIFTSKMASDSEIIAMLSGGMSFHRMMLPYMISSTFVFIMSFVLGMYVIPPANKTRLAFEQKYVKARFAPAARNTHYQIDPGTYVYVESFSSWNNTAYKFTLETLEGNKLKSKISAESAVWDTTNGSWRLRNCFIRTFHGASETVVARKQIDTVISLTARDFYRMKSDVQTLSAKDLNELINTQRLRGDKNVMYALIEKNTRIAMPFSAFILTIIGVSLCSKKRRGGMGLNVGIGIALSFTYILFMRFSEMFVYTGSLPASVALWLPNIIFSIVALVLYRIAPK
ncbi:MAG: LptF/LptG family permease [Bacteroidales bacterium]|jgi:lipopolysaccharide export system permease protein|nr:LptF/LptG family permease [Bacteroidales bacterium]MCI2121636.1 LptF/LptG family permease [Bacteroidales bacterium]MCI2146280.1 LptF/LptG family permease [Bacteroidales bacterium]